MSGARAAAGSAVAALRCMADKNDDIAGEVNRLKGNPNSQLSDFYAARREEEEKESEVSGPVQKVTDEKGGARRDSFFKRRDYD
jgi:hypothetical protein